MRISVLKNKVPEERMFTYHITEKFSRLLPLKDKRQISKELSKLVQTFSPKLMKVWLRQMDIIGSVSAQTPADAEVR